MILDQLILHNFGVYRGRHVFELTPKSKDRPVILIGALNGSGKTTFLEGLQLAFFGKLSPRPTSTSHSYEENLRRSINRGVQPDEGAAIEVSFREIDEGVERSYRVHRSWRQTAKGMKEQFEVMCDGDHDEFLTETWPEFIEEIFPTRLAPLFLFDGEKIEQFADLENSAQALSTTVHALLGLDIVDQLLTDLDVFQRRKTRELKGDDERKAIDVVTEELVSLENQRAAKLMGQAEANRRCDQAQMKLAAAHKEFQNQGGDLYDQRDQVAERLKVSEDQFEELKGQLRKQAAGAAPLMLLLPQLSVLSETAAAERETRAAQLVLQELIKRDRALLEAITELDASATLREEIGTFLEQDRGVREKLAVRDCQINLPAEAEGLLTSLNRSQLPDLSDDLVALLKSASDLQDECRNRNREKNAIPEADQIAPLMEAVIDAEANLAEQQQMHIVIQQDIDAIASKILMRKRELSSKLDQAVQSAQSAEDALRIITHAKKSRETLKVFGQRVVASRLAAIENEILLSFASLTRKDALIAGITIDPDSFRLTLRDRNEQMVAPDRLSAGERQIFAVALIWALAKVSGRPMPTVIDTPLSRLDSVHRTHLVERYFPNASHQVILLSTDEEIDDRYYAQIEQYVSHSYTVSYDDETETSRIEDGYTFQEAAA